MNSNRLDTHNAASWPTARLVPLGEQHLLVRFSQGLTETANRAAIEFAHLLQRNPVQGVLEIVPNLVSVLVRYEPLRIGIPRLSGELGVLLTLPREAESLTSAQHTIDVVFDGPDLEEVSETLDLSVPQFIQRHNARPLHALATGFAPGFVYAGFHPEPLKVPRRSEVRQRVAAGSILFAAGQTAIAATEIPTGWHVIGHTGFRNFDPAREPPALIAAGDLLVFEAQQ